MRNPHHLRAWAIAYRDNPNTNPSATLPQALAILIHAHMCDGEWRTTAAIASELGKSVYAVRFVMWIIKDVWGYEASNSRNEGYRRIL
jgi:hypothetical protein